MRYLVIDIENDNSNRYKRKAGNFLYDLIVAIGMKNPYELKSKYIYSNKLKDFQIDEDVLVGFNIKHDLLFLWNLPGIQEFLKRGGTVFDCQVVHYILDGQREKYPSLREVAVRDYGCPEREKLMEPYWDKGVQTHDVPKELVLKDVENDVLDTEAIYLKQLELVRQKGLGPLIETEMDILLALCEMEFNGLKVNKEVLEKQKQELDNQLQMKHTELNEIVRRYWK